MPTNGWSLSGAETVPSDRRPLEEETEQGEEEESCGVPCKGNGVYTGDCDNVTHSVCPLKKPGRLSIKSTHEKRRSPLSGNFYSNCAVVDGLRFNASAARPCNETPKRCIIKGLGLRSDQMQKTKKSNIIREGTLII